MMTIAIIQIFVLLAILVVLERKTVVNVTVAPPAPTPQPEHGPAPATASEQDVRALIRHELWLLDAYEEKHVLRQAERMSQLKHQKKPLRPHGEYDPDQRREHVSIRVLQKFPNPPADFAAILREEIPDEE